MLTFSAVILAGGQSIRMGRDKAWLAHRGQPLIRRQLATVRQLRPAEIFVSARRQEDYAGLGLPVLLDNFPGQGPLAGIEKALEVMRSPLLLVLAVDMPHVTAATLRRLARDCTARLGVVPRLADRIEPLAAFYPASAHRALVTSLGEGVNSAILFAELCVQLGLARFHEVPRAKAGEFANWNSPQDLRRARDE